MASTFKIGISQNIKCDNLVGIPKSGHNGQFHGASFEHNRQKYRALLQSIMGNFKSIIGTSLLSLQYNLME